MNQVTEIQICSDIICSRTVIVDKPKHMFSKLFHKSLCFINILVIYSCIGKSQTIQLIIQIKMWKLNARWDYKKNK